MLKKSIFISPTRERARDFVQNYRGNHVLETFTIPEFINYLFSGSRENLGKREIDDAEKLLLLEEVLDLLKLKHFIYLDVDSFPSTIAVILKYFYLVKANRMEVGENKNFTNEKMNELEKIFLKYEDLKKKRNLVDYADKMISVCSKLENLKILDEFEEIYCDQFENKGVHLWGNLLEKEIYEHLKKSEKTISVEMENKKQLKKLYYNEVFSRYNEIEEAARIAKSILQKNKCNPNDIVVAVGKLDNYVPGFEQVFSKYGLSVFVTRGTGLGHFPIFIDAVKQLKKGKSIDELLETLSKRFYLIKKNSEELGLEKISYSIMKNLSALQETLKVLRRIKKLDLNGKDIAQFLFDNYKDRSVYAGRAGINVQELNQLVYRSFEHVIVLGVDSESLPIVGGDNFLYSSRDMEKFFGQNNSYMLSSFHLGEIFNNNENVYIVKAKNSEKVKLELSQIVLEEVPEMGDEKKRERYPVGKDARNKEDLLVQDIPSRVKLDDNGEKYVESITSPMFTGYDGILKNFSREFRCFSVSQFNSYARCPLNYYFNSILRIKPPESSEEFDPMQMGSLAHECYQLLGSEVLNGKYDMPQSMNKSVKNKMLAIAKIAYKNMLKEAKVKKESVHHKIQFHALTRGLVDEPTSEKEKGVLRTFLDYTYDGTNGNGDNLQFIQSVELEIKPNDFEIEGIKIKGFIDRVDLVENKSVLIDYKPTKTVNDNIKNELFEKFFELKEFQLPVYSLYANEHLSKKKDTTVEAFLLSFKNGKPCEFSKVKYDNDTFSFENESGEYIEDKNYEKKMKKAIKKIVSDIKKGKFNFSLDEDACQWCNFVTICHRNVLHGVKEQIMSRFAIDNNMAISAGAGTGKTYTLSRRYINLLLGFEFFKEEYSSTDSFDNNSAEKSRANPWEIVTITYTEAAASEMRDRINQLISETINASKGRKIDDKSIMKALKHYGVAIDYVISTLGLAQSEMIYAEISTIHSFCLGVVRRYSDVLRVDVSPIVIPDDEKKILFSQCLTEVLEENVETMFELIDTIGQFRLNTVAWLYLNDGMFRRNMKNFINTGMGDLESHEFYASLIAGSKYGFMVHAASQLEELEGYARNNETYEKYKNYFITAVKCILEPGDLYPETVRIFQVVDEGKELRNEFQKNFKEFAKYFIKRDSEVETLFKNTLQKIVLLTEKIYEKYIYALGKANWIDFDIIINNAHELITSGRFESDWKFFMIDEFQDTNELQWEIFHTLAEKNSSNVFLVGDEKQSIYSFQGAEVDVFQKAAIDISAEKIPISVNFRSRKPILDFVNDCFCKLLGTDPELKKVKNSISDSSLKSLVDLAESMGIDPASCHDYYSLEPCSKKNDGSIGDVTWLVSRNEEISEELDEDVPSIQEIEYGNIARLIYKICNGQLSTYEDVTAKIKKDEKAIAVLFDSRSGMDVLKYELEQMGVPVLARVFENLYESKEAQEIYLVLRFIVNLHENTEWKFMSKYQLVGALRSNIIRMDDTSIYDIWVNKNAEAVIENFKELIHAKENMSISDLISFIIYHYDLRTVYRHLDDYEQKCANLDSLIEKAKVFEKEHGSDLKSYVDTLEKYIFFSDYEEESALFEAKGRNSVLLTTIHSSKGLEYPMVVFVHTMKDLAGQQSREIFKHSRMLAGDEFRTTFGFKVQGSSHVAYELSSLLSGSRHVDEKKRLLYVALTRAEDHLVISVPPPGKRVPRQTYLSFLTGQYDADFREVVNDVLEKSNPNKLNKFIDDNRILNSKFLVLDNEEIPTVERKVNNIDTVELPVDKLFELEDDETSVTGQLAHDELPVMQDEASLLGTAFHEMAKLYFDELDDLSIVKQAIEDVCAAFMLESSAGKKLKIFVNNLVSMEIYSEIKKSKERFPELGFSRPNEKGKVVNGIIDLVYRSNEGLVVLDYKTNSLEKTTAKKIVEKNGYDKQVEEYARVVEEISREKVFRKVLVFVDSGEVFVV